MLGIQSQCRFGITNRGAEHTAIAEQASTIIESLDMTEFQLTPAWNGRAARRISCTIRSASARKSSGPASSSPVPRKPPIRGRPEYGTQQSPIAERTLGPQQLLLAHLEKTVHLFEPGGDLANARCRMAFTRCRDTSI